MAPRLSGYGHDFSNHFLTFLLELMQDVKRQPSYANMGYGGQLLPGPTFDISILVYSRWDINNCKRSHHADQVDGISYEI